MSDINVVSNYRYYYCLLNDHDKRIYDVIVKGISGLKKLIIIPPTDRKSVEKITDYIRLEIPEFYYIKSITMGLLGSYVVNLVYEYKSNLYTAKSILENAEDAIRGLRHECDNKSDFEKVILIHDYLIRRCRYSDKNDSYSHEMLGAILYGNAVCEGISKAFLFIANRVGIKALTICGELVQGHERHSWNKILIEGSYTNVDVTFDMGISMDNHIRYDYVGVCDNYLVDRVEDEIAVVAHKNYSFYVRERLFASCKGELEKIVLNKLKIANWLTFQIPLINISNEQMLEVLNEIIQSNFKGRLSKYTIDFVPNKELCVYSCRVRSISG